MYNTYLLITKDNYPELYNKLSIDFPPNLYNKPSWEEVNYYFKDGVLYAERNNYNLPVNLRNQELSKDFNLIFSFGSLQEIIINYKNKNYSILKFQSK